MRPSSHQITAASRVPQPKPDWSRPAPLGRARLGQVSATMATPVLHSLPIAMPVTKRSATSMVKVWLSAVRPENTA